MASALAELRAYEDEAGSRLTIVREELVRLNALAREIPTLERRVTDLRGDRSDSPYRLQNATEIARQLDVARAARVERKRLRLEEASLLRQIERVRRGLQANGIRKVSLPVLENIEIAAPCNVSWADMDGDTDVRFCGECKKDVYNLSMMSRDEADAVLGASAGKGLCVRLFRREDGTVLTQDCAIGVRNRRFWKRTKGVAAAGMIAAGLGMAYASFSSKCVVQTAGTAGAMAELRPE